MPIYPWENIQQCCTYIDVDRDYDKSSNGTINEIQSILSNLTQKLRGTESNNCSNCQYRESYRDKGLCYKPNEDIERIRNAKLLDNCLGEI